MESDDSTSSMANTILSNQKLARFDNFAVRNMVGGMTATLMIVSHATQILDAMSYTLDCRDIAFPMCNHMYSNADIDTVMQELYNRGFSCRHGTIRKCIFDEYRTTTVVGLTEECQRELKRGSDTCKAIVVQNTWYPACKDVTMDSDNTNSDE
jgi:hypothetical protein